MEARRSADCKASRKRARNESSPVHGIRTVHRTRLVVLLAAAASLMHAEAFVLGGNRGYSTSLLAERELVLTKSKPMQAKPRKARPSPLLNEQLLKSLGDQFVTLTEPKLKATGLGTQPAVTESADTRPATTPLPISQNRVTSPSISATTSTKPRKMSSQKTPGSPGRKTPDFTSLKTRRKPKTTKKGETTKFFNLADGSNVSEYYFTKLLTRDEEYSLGIKVQFMVKCHRVHEGLSLQLDRIPTIEEWANACGFVEHDSSALAVVEEEIRPSGYRDMFEEIDPSDFVGNGIAANAGPGRGRGRRKKPAPASLGDYYDDSEYQAQRRAREKNPKLARPSKPTEPINRGTPSDFCNLMEEARIAKQRMMQTNMRLVVSIANKYRKGGVNFQDLVQEGSLGLHRATEKFDPRKGFKFSTYASWWIQQAVFRCNAYHSRTIRLPVHIHNLLHKIRRSRFYLKNTLGRPPTNEEMATHLGLPVEKFTKILTLTKQSISLDICAYNHNPKDFGHESEDALIDTVAIESSGQQGVDRGFFREDLKEMMEILTESEKQVIILRYGLVDGMTRTVTLVAAEMRQSKSWVRSQECRALRKLRRPWYEQKMREHQEALMQ